MAMIFRIYRCTVAAGREDEFREFAYSKSHPWLKERPGLVAFYAGRPLPGSADRSRCMVQIWDSLAALQESFGENWSRGPTLPDELRGVVESATVEHYDLADEFRSDLPRKITGN